MLEKKKRTPITKGIAKVPVIMQMEALECGAVCLAMIMAYYDKWISLEQVRSDCGVSRNGSNGKKILTAARNYGFKAQGYRLEIDELIKEGTFPCIIHWNMKHFVVLKGIKNGKAYINDPARGSCEVSMEEFDQSFTGICMMLEPSETFVPEGKPKSVLRFVYDRLKGMPRAITFLLLISIITVMIDLIKPGLLRVFLDRILTQQNPEWFYPFLVLVALLSFLQILISSIKTICSTRINGKIAVLGNMTFLWKVMHMPIEFFSQRTAGDIQIRQESNADVAEKIITIFAPLLLKFFMMIFYLGVMIRYSFILTVVGVCSILLNIYLSWVIAQKRINFARMQMRDHARLEASTFAGINIIETIKSSGAENGYFQKWAGFQASANAQIAKFHKENMFLINLPSLILAVSDMVTMLLGVYFALHHSFTVGMIMAFQGFLQAFSKPAMSLVLAGQSMIELRAAMERIDDVLQYPEDTNQALDSEGDVQVEFYNKLSGNIELKHVTFGYSKLDKPLITDFNLTIESGESVAIVGASGCGKSTISKLISGLYTPWDGEILFDGKPMCEIKRSEFFGSLAVVDQENMMFEDSVANNIKMLDDTIEDFEMILAARDAQIHDEIMGCEGGYHYKIAEEGKNFSVGQCQRLEIARVLAQDPTIIILDEATSALDAKTEYEVVKSIRDRGVTIIVIAHRLSTIRNCDKILVLDKGVIVEQGTHEELYALGGKYTELISND